MDDHEKILLVEALITDIRFSWLPCQRVGTRNDPRALLALRLWADIEDGPLKIDPDVSRDFFAELAMYISGRWEGKIIAVEPIERYRTLPFSLNGRSAAFMAAANEHIKTPGFPWEG